MKSQPNRNYISNDKIMTPIDLAEKIVKYFKPKGKYILEPCKGTGNFIKAFKKYAPKSKILWCEINQNKDFMDFQGKVDWIITNPPWSKIRNFLIKSLETSNNVCFLMTINHLWTKARIRDINDNSFGIKEIIIFDTPNNFPPLGFQVGIVHLKKYHQGDIKFTQW